ncbi:hypothetical protein ACHAWX_000345 [Stephanocyclus meneghinianus]
MTVGLAILALQEPLEVYNTYIFEDVRLCVVHGKRVTGMPKEIELILLIHWDIDINSKQK